MTNIKPSITLKVLISVFSAILFVIFSLPITYTFTNDITKKIGFSILNNNGCVNGNGILVHGILFGIVVFVTM